MKYNSNSSIALALLMMMACTQITAQDITSKLPKSDTLFKEPKNPNYQEIILGIWCQPHNMDFSFEFKKDGTFCAGYCDTPCTFETTGTGTYTISGHEGWLIFKDGYHQKIRLFYQAGYVLFVYDKSGTDYYSVLVK